MRAPAHLLTLEGSQCAHIYAAEDNEEQAMYLKEIFTIKVKYAKICIPGHATAHVSGCSRIQTQRAPAPYSTI